MKLAPDVLHGYKDRQSSLSSPSDLVIALAEFRFDKAQVELLVEVRLRCERTGLPNSVPSTNNGAQLTKVRLAAGTLNQRKAPIFADRSIDAQSNAGRECERRGCFRGCE